MRTWNIATVSAPSSTNMPAMFRKVKAMSRAEVVIRFARTTPAPAATMAIVRTANSAGSMKSSILINLWAAPRRHAQGWWTRSSRMNRSSLVSCRGPQPLAERDEPTTLDVGQQQHEGGEQYPVGDRYGHQGVGEHEQQGRRDHEIRERQRDQHLPAE